MDEAVRNSSNSTDVEKTLCDSANLIALQTMKERCSLLQQRLNTVEKENIHLSIQCSKYKTGSSISDPEIDKLNASIAQLTKEKSQLAHHIFIVACENKKLWSSLSRLAKSQSIDKEITYNNLNTVPLPEKIEYAVPNLARSQTFTQTAPNIKRFSKIEGDVKDVQNSLEEISLKLINSFLLEKSELINQYEQMVEMQNFEDKPVNNRSMGVSSLDNYNTDAVAEIRKQIEKMNEMKRIASQQQLDLKKYISTMESNKKGENICQNCKNVSKNLPVLLPKVGEDLDTSDVELLETTTAFNDSKRLNQDINKKEIQVNYKGANDELVWRSPGPQSAKKENNNKRICPMCGEVFMHSLFDTFEQHVESHFIAEDEIDSVSGSYEVVLNSIGNNFN